MLSSAEIARGSQGAVKFLLRDVSAPFHFDNTLEGFFSDPIYGGNRDKLGWKLVGFELVGHEAAEPQPGYDGVAHLHHEKG